MSKKLMTKQQAAEIVLAISKRLPTLTYEEAESVLNAKATLAQGVAAAFEPFIMGGNESIFSTVITETFFEIDVPYKAEGTIAELVEAGRYDWVNEDVSDDHFPNVLDTISRVGLKLFNFDRRISTEEVVLAMKKEGFVAANAAELLSLGNQYKNLQKQFPLVALGQRWDFSPKNSFVLCLAWHGLLRRIYLLTQHKREWPAHTRFVAKHT